MRKLKKYVPTKFMAKDSHYDKEEADYVVSFIEQLKHTKGEFYNQPFELIDWQEQIIRDVFGILKPDGCREFSTVFIEVPKKCGKSELAAGLHYICYVQMGSREPRYMAVLQTVIRVLWCLMWLVIWFVCVRH